LRVLGVAVCTRETTHLGALPVRSTAVAFVDLKQLADC